MVPATLLDELTSVCVAVSSGGLLLRTCMLLHICNESCFFFSQVLERIDSNSRYKCRAVSTRTRKFTDEINMPLSASLSCNAGRQNSHTSLKKRYNLTHPALSFCSAEKHSQAGPKKYVYTSCEYLLQLQTPNSTQLVLDFTHVMTEVQNIYFIEN
jgi:hypothetical protein